MKRFTDTSKWKDPWFRKLSPAHKLLWGFICDECDNSGLWKCDFEAASFFTGAKVERNSSAEAFGDRVIERPGGNWWIRKFVGFQFGDLSDSRPHQSVAKLLATHGIPYPYPIDTLSTNPPRAIDSPKDKDQDKDKDQEKDKDKEGTKAKSEFPKCLDTLDFRLAWSDWVIDRKARKIPITERAASLQLKQLEGYGHSKAIESINASIKNGWQGLFDPGETKSNGKPNQKGFDRNQGTLNAGNSEAYDFAKIQAARGEWVSDPSRPPTGTGT